MCIRDRPCTITIDLGEEQTITSWTLVNDMSSYGLADFEIKGSNDGQEYTTIVSVEGNTDVTANGAIANPAPYRYYQLVGTKSFTYGGDIRELELNGHKTITYESEVVYNNQRPRLVASEMDTTITLEKKNDQVLDLNEVLANAIAEANAQSFTVNGNTAGSLEGAAWLEPDYVLELSLIHI